jgi:hypothetical protein
VWKDIVTKLPLVGEWTVWKVGNGKNIRIGDDPWLGAGKDCKFLDLMFESLRNQNVDSLSDDRAIIPQPRGRTGWKSTNTLELSGGLAKEWNNTFDYSLKIS